MDKKLNEHVSEHVSQANTAGISTLITLGIDVTSSKAAIKIASKHDSVYASVGIYPGEVDLDKSARDTNIKAIEALASHEKVIAIGETGLDEKYFYDIPLDIQIENLIHHIQVTNKTHKPLVLHNRGTAQTLLAVLSEQWQEKMKGNVVFHCCEPNYDLLQFAKEKNIYIGVDGDVTYNEEKRSFVKDIPLEQLVIETDSPYLLPEPLRSKKEFPNVPKNLTYIAQAIADIKEVSLETIDKVTTQNAKQLFNLDN